MKDNQGKVISVENEIFYEENGIIKYVPDYVVSYMKYKSEKELALLTVLGIFSLGLVLGMIFMLWVM